MDEYLEHNKTIKYTYTDKEFACLFFNSPAGDGYMISLIFFIADVISVVWYYNNHMAGNDIIDKSLVFMIAFFSILMIISLIVTYRDMPKNISLLKAEQKIFFIGDIFYFESGEHVFKVHKKYISKIRQTKNFYIINFALTRYDKEINDLFIHPMIPRRAVLETEMKHLASNLNINYKKSLIWK